MLHLFDQYRHLFASWTVIRYEQEGESYLLHIVATLKDDSRLEIRDYLFADSNRKCAYQWMEVNRSLCRRWDNTPHWPGIATAPHHVHLPGQELPEASVITNLEDLLAFLDEWFQATDDKP